MVSHPPYTNLFDALNFVAWAMMVCYLIIERKWGLRIVGVLAVALALVAMGEASLVTDQEHSGLFDVTVKPKLLEVRARNICGGLVKKRQDSDPASKRESQRFLFQSAGGGW